MEDTVIKEVIKKSELAAKDAYEYQWITYPEYGFLQFTYRGKDRRIRNYV